MAQQSHSSYVAQSPFRDAASRDHFRLWHQTDMPIVFRDVQFQGQSGKHLLALSFSGFDPEPTKRDNHSSVISSAKRATRATSSGSPPPVASRRIKPAAFGTVDASELVMAS
jgi:hypothetical protein